MPGSRLNSYILASGAIALVAVAVYEVGISPYLHPEKWNELQKQTQESIDKAKTRPPDLKEWKNPWKGDK